MLKGLVSGDSIGAITTARAEQDTAVLNGLQRALRRGAQIVWDGEQGQKGQGGLSRENNTRAEL